ncbi:aldehyde dehydrogenase [Hoeflea prorocentri]|uniref:Aldehyde dehydrogenase n=1 Tax=Hoeflea prorocentri TaxID=1922333 RepID=A0A9X3UE57_9HYPH|nr:aldehyde dehydrogenase [Hoeflea prorocentri]MCY6379758.1 aldehyde dehydrogenase [Hoeflea prorocentri]MDA5397558.1 aldehyde dehydrogenase [Hoeflea prorocentri]
MTETFREDLIFIGGQWRQGRGAPITSLFAAEGVDNTTISGASSEDVEEAIAVACRAQSDPAWQNLKAHERASFLYRISQGISENIERIAWVQSRDTSKTLTETRALAASAAGTFRYFAAVLETADDLLTVPRGDYLTASVHESMGPVAAITPWNSPIASDAQKVAPALAAGNAVLLKPSSWSPLVSLELARIIEEAGLPAGLFSVLPGSGREVGNLLVEHPDIQKVSFTGGTVTGKRIAHSAAEKLMPVSLELGGKSPTIVFEDCDVDLAIAGILFGIFSSTGQSCIAGSRLFVHESIFDRFVSRLVEATRALSVGHPFDADTQVSSMVHLEHRQSVEAYVELARQEGGTILTGGRRPDSKTLAGGAYYMPTIISGLDNAAQVCREEIFGPVLVVMPFSDEADVIAQANDNHYGLACGIWSRDHPKCWRVARAIRAGTVWVNTYKQFSISTPFGGDGASGMGREKGRAGLRAYQRQKSIYEDMSGRPHPWARWPGDD